MLRVRLQVVRNQVAATECVAIHYLAANPTKAQHFVEMFSRPAEPRRFFTCGDWPESPKIIGATNLPEPSAGNPQASLLYKS
jgi:hypothetical protein